MQRQCIVAERAGRYEPDCRGFEPRQQLRLIRIAEPLDLSVV